MGENVSPKSKTTTIKLRQVIDKTGWVAFLLFMVFLPVTSFPFFPPAIGGDALVRPLSLYPLLVVIVLVIIPRLFTQRLPRQLLALGAFILIVVLSGVISSVREINPMSEISSWERVLRTLITLFLGCAFYLAVVLSPRSRTELKQTLAAMYIGFAIALAWGTIQLVYIVRFSKPYFRVVNELQGYISTRRLFDTRISGMTFEPNWFAEQIVVLLLPWLLASVLTGKSVFQLRWRWLTFELILLLWSTIILLFTYSRSGLITFSILAFVVLLLANFRYFSRRSKESNNRRESLKKTFFSWGFMMQVVAVIAVLGVAFFAIGTKNVFFARIWGYWSDRSNFSISGYLNYLGFEARIIYGEAAFNMYQSNPVLGIGPGNYALYFNEMLPNRPLAKTPEVLRLVTPDENRDRLVTAKNFFLRLMAETGILGTAAFIVFLISIFGSAISLVKYKELGIKFWGIGGVLALIAFGFSTLSFDSFVLPNMWVTFGLVTVSSFLLTREQQDKESNSTL